MENRRCRPPGAIPPWVHRQADPMIYSQRYLRSLGLAVTWDNPDIHVELAAAPGVPVDAHTLRPDTDYLVVARVWNGSTTGPAPGLPVKVSYLEFGAGTTRHDVGTTKVDLPVKAAAGCPAFATVPWHTPATPGHYCLQVELLWDDDANPADNLGQSNTDVKPLNSPHATFAFPVRNDRPERATVTLTLDGYAVPPLDACGEDRPPEQQRSRLERHRVEHWPIPNGWRVTVHPAEVTLDPGERAEVTVDVTAPDGFAGRQAINVHAGVGSELLGGVTLYVDGTG
ncbi:NEW3 domain-containing protein [Kitasatospora sp. NPDC005856]|uniref:NEW3 domain-containing protein n=1 Tax=Kitasatospora sp. NPDC005856 TaxID=3154566 RepID=UPI0034068AA5